MALRLIVPAKFDRDQGIDKAKWAKLLEKSKIDLNLDARLEINTIISLYQENKKRKPVRRPGQFSRDLRWLAGHAAGIIVGLREIRDDEDWFEAFAEAAFLDMTEDASHARAKKFIAKSHRHLVDIFSHLGLAADRVPRGKGGSHKPLLTEALKWLSITILRHRGRPLSGSKGDREFAVGVMRAADKSLKEVTIENAVRGLRKWNKLAAEMERSNPSRRLGPQRRA